jgi:hypothetical protein
VRVRVRVGEGNYLLIILTLTHPSPTLEQLKNKNVTGNDLLMKGLPEVIRRFLTPYFAYKRGTCRLGKAQKDMGPC